MSDNLSEEVDKLKAEAVSLLDSMFNIQEGDSSNATNRIVDCIVSAAILEAAQLIVASQKQYEELVALKNAGKKT